MFGWKRLKIIVFNYSMIEYSSTGDPPIEDSSIEDSTSDNNLGVPSDNDLSYNDLSYTIDLSDNVVSSQDLAQVPTQDLGLIQILGTLPSIDELPTTEVVAGSAYIIDETIWIYSNTGWVDMLSTELIPSELDVTSSGEDDEIQLLSLNEILALPDTLDDSLSFWSDPLAVATVADALVADALKASPDAALYIAPVRNVTTIASEMKPMSYRTNTSELIYDSTAAVLPGPGGPQGRTGTTTGPTGFRGATGTAGTSLLGPSGPIGISVQGSSFGDYLYWGTSNWVVGSQNIILGRKAIFTNQGTNAIAIGENAGQVSQNVRSIAIGQGAGQTNQLANAIAIGQGAGQTNQQTNAIAIGQFAGQLGQGVNAIAVGQSAGQTNQWSGAIAVGAYAGLINQGTNAIAVANGNGVPLTPYIALNPNSWTPVANSQTTLLGVASSIKSVAYGQNSAGNRLWVAGAYSASATSSGVLASSINGTNWTSISGSKTLLFGGDAQVNAVAYGQDGAGNRLWIAGAQGLGTTNSLAYSYHGQTGWTPISGSKTALFGGEARVHAIAYGQDGSGNRLWVAGGSGTTNVLAYSSNGTNWTPVANSQTILFGGFSTVYSVAYGQDGAGNRLWVAGAYGDTNTLAYSSNGMTGWTTVQNSKTALFGQNAYVQSVAFGQDGAGNRLWVAGANAATAVLAYSYDGTTWTAIANSQTTLFGGFSIVYSVAYGQDVSGNRLWLAGANGGFGTLAYSNDGINWNLIPNTKDGLFGGAAAAYSLAYGQDTNGSPFWVAGGDGTTAILAYMNNQTLLPNTNANQSQNAISIGQNAGFNTQQTNAIAIGLNAGQTNQGGSAIAIGVSAGAFTQRTSAIAIGQGAGQNAQGVSAIAVGQVAGQVNQAANAIAIGVEAGQVNQADSAIAIGADAGQTLQGTNAIAIGQGAGQTNQGTNAIAVGQLAGGFGQGANAIAIGQGAGQTNQRTNAIAIGQSAGQTNQGTNAVAVGQFAGAFGQGANAIAIGQGAGQTNQRTNAIAMGQFSGGFNQQFNAIAIGAYTGQTNQGTNAITIANTFIYPASWQPIANTQTPLFGASSTVRSVAYGQDGAGNRLWVAGALGSSATAILAYSYDGTNWTAVADSKTTLFGGDAFINSIAYGQDATGNRLWVAGASGNTNLLAYSSNGTNWTAVAGSKTTLFGGNANVRSVAYGQDGAGNRLWVAGAEADTNCLAYSYNGVSWIPISGSKTTLFGGNVRVTAVAYGQDNLGNRLWVAGSNGSTNILAYSSNGTNWTPFSNSQTTLFGSSTQISSVSYGLDGAGNRLWVAGASGNSITAVLAYSSNGMTGWTVVANSKSAFGGNSRVNTVTYGANSVGNRLWLAGGFGDTITLAYSSDGVNWKFVPDSKATLSDVLSVAYGQDSGGLPLWIAGGFGSTITLAYTNNLFFVQGVGENQGENAIAIGQLAGAFGQSVNAIAIGSNAGQTNQQTNAIAIGVLAGQNNQATNAVALGLSAGQLGQGSGAIALGTFAGQTNQGTNAIAIGQLAGSFGQYLNAIAIGVGAGQTNQGTNAIAIGVGAGQTNQGTNGIAIGNLAGAFNQGVNAIAIGFGAGQTNQGTNAIAIGIGAGQTNQGTNAIAIGIGAGQTNQTQNAIALGFQAGSVVQGDSAIAIGRGAGQTNQGTNAIAIGNLAGAFNQGVNAVAIGFSAGQTNQGTNAIAIGFGAGQTNQGTNAIAVGFRAGSIGQCDSAIAIGRGAGQTNQGTNAIAIGVSIGSSIQGENAISIGCGILGDLIPVATVGDGSTHPYSNNLFQTGTISGGASATFVSIVFDGQCSMENGADVLRFYSDPGRIQLIYQNTGTSWPPVNFNLGTIYYSFTTDGSVVAYGWQLTASFFGPNSVSANNNQLNNSISIGSNTGQFTQGTNAIAIGTNAGSTNQGTNAIAIGLIAGATGQSANSVAIGQQSGQTNQGAAAVAIGTRAGQTNQGTNAVAIGFLAGSFGQLNSAIAIGLQTGQTNQGTNAIAIGQGAGQTNQVTNAVAIGFSAGGFGQGFSAVAIGQQAGQTNQGTNAVAIGQGAGQTNQLTNAVAIGFLAGASGQGFSAVAIGQQAGQTNQATNAIAIGLRAGQTNQVTNAIAIGFQAGQTGQNLAAIAIGLNAGFTNQGTNSIAIGANAGQTNLGQFSVSIGAGSNVVDSFAIAIGFNAGSTQSSGSRSFSLGTNSNGGIGFGAQAGSIRGLTNGIGIGGFYGIGAGFGIGAGSGMGNTFSATIGYNTGFTNAVNAAAIGFQAGQIRQQSGAIAIGFQAGQTNQGTNALAIGFKAGQVAQGSGAIAIGYQSGQFSQGQFAFAIGNQVGQISQGAYAVAIGNKAGVFQQGTNAVTIASSSGIDEPNSNGFWNPVLNSQTALFGGSATVNSVAYGQDGLGNQLWVAGAYGQTAVLAYSSNGISWTPVLNSQTTLFGGQLSQVYSVAFGQDGAGNRLWVAGGYSGVGVGATSILAYSSNGISWTPISGSQTTLFGGPSTVYSVAHGQDGAGNRLWVAGASGTNAVLATSSNGTNWSPVADSKTTIFGGNATVYSVAYGQDGAGNRLWVAGANGATAVLAYSSNGTNWTPVANSQTTLLGGSTTVRSVAYGQDSGGNRLWMAGGGGAGTTNCLAYSSNGTSWIPVANSKTNLFGGNATVYSVAYGLDAFGNRLWVAGSDGTTNVLAYSLDGRTNWTSVPNSQTTLFGGSSTVVSVAFGQDGAGNRLWVAGGFGTTAILATSYFPTGLPMSSAFGQGQSAISIGYHAGQVTQGTAAVAIGFQAGQTNQGQNAVAIGSQAGQVGQGTSAVSIGFQAGFTNQGTRAIAIGYQMGQTNQPDNSIDIGFQSGFTNQRSAAIAIGFNAGFSGQGTNSVAIGLNAGFTNQGPNAAAIGFSAGQFNQGTNAVAVGFQVGQTNQGQGAVALGYSDIASLDQLYNSSSTGGFNQGFNAVAVGLYAGNYFQRSGAIALGYQAGQTNQGTNAIAIGFQSGLVNQGTNAIAIGYQIGLTNQLQNTINIGFDVGEVGQGTNTIAIGVQAGQVSQGASAIAIGQFAGQTNQQTNAIAIGLGAGAFNQQLNAIALGVYTGQTNQGTNAIMIGTSFIYNSGLVNPASWSPVTNSQTTLFGGEFSLVNSIAYGQDGAGNRLWVAAANGITNCLAYSSNGTSWTAISGSKTTLFGGNGNANSVAYGQDGAGNRLWVAGTSGTTAVFVYSSNGTSWTPLTNSQTTIFGGSGQVTSVAYGEDGAGNRLWVAGAQALAVLNGTAILAYSSNGMTGWTAVSGSKTNLFGGDANVNSVAYGQDGAGNRLWVAGAQGATNCLAYSTNGTGWTPVANSKTNLFGGDAQVYSVAYGQDSTGNRLWVAGALGATSCLAYSSNGITGWTPIANSKTSLFGGDALVRSVAYGQDASGNRLWVAGSIGSTAVLAYSTNGITDWTAVPNSQTTLFGASAGVRSLAFGQDSIGNPLWVSGAYGTTAVLAYTNNLFLLQGVSDNQIPNTIEIGVQAGQTLQATNAIAIGVQAGQTNQRTNAIAIGQLAGAFNQSQNAIAIGQRAGQTNQATNAIAIGQGAGQTNQATNAIAIGQGAGQTNQSQNTIAIGQLAGAFGQFENTIAIGQGAGQTNQRTNAIAIGQGAGQTNQSQNTIAIGQLAGAFNQSVSAIAIGNRAGQTNQATNAIAITSSGASQVVNPVPWNAVSTPAGVNTVYSLANGRDSSGNRLWVYGTDGTNAVLAYSSDGRTGWTTVANSQTNLFGGSSIVYSVAYGQDGAGNGLWLAGASGTTNCLAYSTDGRTNWTAISDSKTNLFGGAAIVRTVAYGQDGAGNRLWVAGSNGATNILAYSSDGTTWTPIVNSQTTLFGGAAQVNSVAYGQDGAGNRLWVAGAQGATNCLAYSPDGTTWTPISGSKTALFGGNAQVNAVAYGQDGAGNRLWLAGGNGTNAILAYSSNGITGWTAVAGGSLGMGLINSISFGRDNAGNQLWITSSSVGTSVGYSLNGITGWTTSNNLVVFLYSTGFGQDSFGTPLWLVGSSNANNVYFNSNSAQTFGSLNQGLNAIAIGQAAGQISQGQTAIAIGSNAGQMIQGQNAVAIGQGAGQTLQGTNAVAIGPNAGQLVQPANTVAIGPNAGQASQGIQTVAIGQQAGQTLQGTSSVAIGFQSGSFSQGLNSVAIGFGTGQTNQGTQSVAIGFSAGQTNQGTNTVAIGILAGTSGQGFAAVAIGFSAGQTNQGANAVAIGQLAGQTNQGTNAVAVGFQSGSTGQGAGAVAIGSNAGFTNQGTNSVAIGANAGQTNLGQFAISIGAGSNVVDSYGIAIGFNAGSTQSAGARSFSLGTNSNGGIGFGAKAGSIRGETNGIGVGGFNGIGGGFIIGANSGLGNTFSAGIGYNIGFTNGPNAAAIGFQAGQIRQQSGAIAIGFGAGQTNQGTNALAIGFKAGQVAQGSGAIAIGFQTGQFSQGQFAFAIGNQVGQVSQGQFAVAIGQRAGAFQQGTNAVTIASSDGVGEPTSDGFWAPVPNSQTTLFGPSSNVRSVAFGQDGSGNRLWVAGASGPTSVLAYSSNGINWTPVANSQTTLFGGQSIVYSVAYGQDGSGNGLWMAGAGFLSASSVLAYSSNGITGWTPVANSKTTLFGGDAQVSAVAYGQDSTGNRLWVAGAVTGTTAILAFSSNGITNWTPIAGSKTALFGGDAIVLSVAYGQDSGGNRLWVAGGGGLGTTATLAYSSNGRTGWTPVANSQTTLFGGFSTVNSVAYGQDSGGNRLWVAGALGTTNCLAYSSNGTNWIPVANSKTNLFGGNPQVYSVAYGQDAFGNRLWVAGSNGTTNVLAYSYDGRTNWTAIPNSNIALFGGSSAVFSAAFGQDGVGNPFWVAGANATTAILATAYFPGGAPMSSAFGQGQSAISIGYHAGQVTQGTAAVAIGFQAGQTNQGQSSIAIGSQAGQVGQGTNAVAIGQNAGFTNQGSGAIAIGFIAGQTNQGTNAIAIGFSAGQTNQGRGAVAIGFQAGFVNQNTNAVAIGLNAGFTNQGLGAVAIGFSAGFLNQGTNAVAVGFLAGQTNQGLGAVALGNSDIDSVNQLYNSSSAGGFNQGFYAVAIGSYAGNYLQGSGAIAVGYQAGQTNQRTNAIAIGFQAGQVNQGTNAIAIGFSAGQTNQAQNTISIGQEAGEISQSTNAIAIGVQAGQVSQGASAIAIGFNAGQTLQATNAIAIGQLAGSINQGVSAIAIGQFAGQTNQQTNAIAIGQNAGAFGQQVNAIAIGQGAGQTNQATNAIAIGQSAGQTNQGTNAIAIGLSAGAFGQGSGAIALGAFAGQTNQGTNAIAVGTSFIYNTGIFTPNIWAPVANSQTTIFGASSAVSSVAYGQDSAGNRLWVAGGFGTTSVLAYSFNGLNWTPFLNSQTTLFGGQASVYSVAYGQDGAGNRLWVAGALGATAVLATSSNGTSWSPVANSQTTLFGGLNSFVTSVAYGQDSTGNRLWVAGAEGSTAILAFSSNGTGWTPFANSKTTLFGVSSRVLSVAYGQDGAGNRLWLAGAISLGGTATLAYSSDGRTNWTLVANSKTNLFGGDAFVRSIAYGQDSGGNRLWVAGAQGATNCLAYSPDGTTWTPVSNSKTNLFGGNAEVWSVAYGQDNAGNRLWVAGAGAVTGGITNILAYSSDGRTNWTPVANSQTTIFGGASQALSVGFGQVSTGNPLWVSGASGTTATLAYMNMFLTQGVGANQGQNAIAIGQNAGAYTQAVSAIAIGVQAGQTNQGTNAIAMGFGAGALNQGGNSIAIGFATGQINQQTNAIAIGASAGQTLQGTNAIAMGVRAGQTNQGLNAIAIGLLAGAFGQDDNAIALGFAAGQTNQGTNAIAIGTQSGQTNQTQNAIAIGLLAGAFGQGDSAIAIGFQTGQTNQQTNAIAIGSQSGQTNQSQNTIAIGLLAGAFGQGDSAIAIGFQAGQTNQQTNAIAIGVQAGQTNQSTNAIAIGQSAGALNQGNNSIAIGFGAGQTAQGANSIVLNATGVAYASTATNALYIRPIRTDAATTTMSVLMYNQTTKEVLRSTNTTAAGTKTFVIDHPDDAKKYLVHSCLEGPETGVFYRGIGQIVDGHSCVVSLPPYVDSLATHFTVQLTPSTFEKGGAKSEATGSEATGSEANEIVDRTNPKLRCSPVKNNQFTVYGSRNCQFFWSVYGRRGEVEVEPLKSETEVQGVGPYKYV